MSESGDSAYMAVLSDRRALGWVLDHSRLAFPPPRSRLRFPAFKANDVIYLYATRGCFGNPSRDRGRVIAKAIAASDARTNMEQPVEFGGRTLPIEVDIQVQSLTPFGQGFPLAEHIGSLDMFPKKDHWMIYLRTSVVPVPISDARQLDSYLAPFDGRRNENVGEYQARARSGVVKAK